MSGSSKAYIIRLGAKHGRGAYFAGFYRVPGAGLLTTTASERRRSEVFTSRHDADDAVEILRKSHFLARVVVLRRRADLARTDLPVRSLGDDVDGVLPEAAREGGPELLRGSERARAAPARGGNTHLDDEGVLAGAAPGPASTDERGATEAGDHDLRHLVEEPLRVEGDGKPRMALVPGRHARADVDAHEAGGPEVASEAPPASPGTEREATDTAWTPAHEDSVDRGFLRRKKRPEDPDAWISFRKDGDRVFIRTCWLPDTPEVRASMQGFLRAADGCFEVYYEPARDEVLARRLVGRALSTILEVWL